MRCRGAEELEIDAGGWHARGGADGRVRGTIHPETVNVVQASAAATARSQTVQIVSTFTQPGEPPSTTRLVYDYQHHRGESFSSGVSRPQPDTIFEGSQGLL